MQSGEGGCWRWRSAAPPWCRLGMVLCLLAGCTSSRPHVDQALKASIGGPDRNSSVAEQYVVRCPDVIEVTFRSHPELSRRVAVGPDGRGDLGELGRLRVEGQTTAEIARTVADAAGVPSADVDVRIIEYNSQYIYLFGEVFGLHRAVPYQGPETVLDLLRRVGGLTPGAEPDDVHVIRSHIADGRPPEVFRIDLRAIVLNNDPSTNLRLQPFDQVYVGQTRQAVLEKCCPPWLRPTFQSLLGWHKAGHAAQAKPPREDSATHPGRTDAPLR